MNTPIYNNKYNYSIGYGGLTFSILKCSAIHVGEHLLHNLKFGILWL